MRLLLDTHCFLWFVSGSRELSLTARELIEEASSQPFLSTASLWEMAIKLSLGKLHLARPFDELIPQQMGLNGIYLLRIEIEHTAVVANLPFHHRDPFDRLLVAQAMVEDMPLLSADARLDEYSIERLW